jgi:tetratricopeptide (TPR) repeat protein
VPETIEANLAMAQEMLASCQYAAAQEHFQAALALAENGAVSLNKYLDCLFGLSSAYCQTGDYDKAESAAVLALSTVQKQMGKNHHLSGFHLQNLAYIRLHLGMVKEAEKLMLEAIEIIEKFYDTEHPELMKPLENLSAIYQEQQQIPKAVQSLERAISIREKCFGADDPGIKFFKNLCREMTSAARKNQTKTKTKEKTADVQLTLFS